LLPVYLARHPDEHQLAAGLASGAFTRDDRLAGIADPVGDVPFDDVERRIYAEFGRYVVTAETTAADAAHAAEERIRALDAELAQVRSEVVEAHAELGRQKQRRVVRIVDGVARLRHPVSDRQE
jgi:glutathione S-transferase